MSALSALVASVAFAGEPVPLDVELARDLGDGLFVDGDPGGALQWYRVARWLDPTSEELAGIQMRVAMGLEASGKYAEATTWYDRVDGQYAGVAAFRTGVCRYRSGSAQWGEDTLAAVRTDYPALSADAYLVEGVLRLEAGQPDHAAQAFASVPSSAPNSAKAAGFAARAGAPPLSKSPALAAGLSVVPGLGQMYTGAMRPAGRNILMAGALGGGTMMMMRMGADGHVWATGAGGAMLAMGTLGWSVNIIDAWKRADRIRDEARQKHADAVRADVLATFPELPVEPAPTQLREF